MGLLRMRIIPFLTQYCSSELFWGVLACLQYFYSIFFASILDHPVLICLRLSRLVCVFALLRTLVDRPALSRSELVLLLLRLAKWRLLDVR